MIGSLYYILILEHRTEINLKLEIFRECGEIFMIFFLLEKNVVCI